MYVYVVGRGHSGSTILDIALSQSDDAAGVGEVVSGLGRANEMCSCGSAADECRFWSKVVERISSDGWQGAGEAGGSLRGFSRITRLPGILMGRGSPELDKHRRLNKSLMEAVKTVSGKGVVVDSSKEITRSAILADSLSPDELRVIHLVRDPVKMVSSNMWRLEQGTGFKFMRRTYKSTRYRPLFVVISAVSWVVGNGLVELMRNWKYQGIRIRYEDLCAQPAEQTGRLEKLLNIDLTGTREFLEGKREAELSHNLGGNQERHKPIKTFDASRSQGRNRLSPLESGLVKFITWPLRKAYGY